MEPSLQFGSKLSATLSNYASLARPGSGNSIWKVIWNLFEDYSAIVELSCFEKLFWAKTGRMYGSTTVALEATFPLINKVSYEALRFCHLTILSLENALWFSF